MKNYVVLLAGTVSLVAAVVKLVFGLGADWVWIVAPLWMPIALAYLIFVGLFVHAFGTGKLEIVPKPVPGAAPVFPLAKEPAKV